MIDRIDKAENRIDSVKNDIDTRVFESFWDLIWKTFEKWDKIPMLYKASDWKTINYTLDTITNKISINDRIFSIKPLEWIIINRVEFTDKKVIIYWKIWIVEWKIEATYIKTIEAIDEIYLYINKNK